MRRPLASRRVHLPALEGRFRLESGDVGLQLLQVGHAGENHGHAGHGLEEAEGPGQGWSRRGAGPSGARPPRRLRRARRPPRRGSMTQTGMCHSFSRSTLSLAVLEGPVQVVELQLAELHVLAVGVQEPFRSPAGPRGRRSPGGGCGRSSSAPSDSRRCRTWGPDRRRCSSHTRCGTDRSRSSPPGTSCSCSSKISSTLGMLARS